MSKQLGKYNLVSESEAEAEWNSPEKQQTKHDRLQPKTILIHAIIIVFELALAVLVVAGTLHNTKGKASRSNRLDILDLNDYNSTLFFKNSSHLLKDSREADLYWQDLLLSGGVVSLDKTWAKANGLRKSATSPSDDSQSIYQVDVYHALHCLNSIRQNLVPEEKPEWNEKHMLHCLDYIRHQLLCSPDVTLITTDDLDEFVLTDQHKCKDFSAVVDWVDRHKWKQFPEFVLGKMKQGERL